MGKVDVEVDKHNIAKGSRSRAFGTLHCAIFTDNNLTITTKRN